MTKKENLLSVCKQTTNGTSRLSPVANLLHSQEPDWRPFLPTVDPSTQGDDFNMIDLLRFAGVA